MKIAAMTPRTMNSRRFDLSSFGGRTPESDSSGMSSSTSSGRASSTSSTSVRILSANAFCLLPVDLLEHGVVDFVRLPVEHQGALVEGDCTIGVLVDEIEEVERAQDRDAVGLDSLEILHDRMGEDRVEAGHRLVGEHDRRVLHQGAG